MLATPCSITPNVQRAHHDLVEAVGLGVVVLCVCIFSTTESLQCEVNGLTKRNANDSVIDSCRLMVHINQMHMLKGFCWPHLPGTSDTQSSWASAACIFEGIGKKIAEKKIVRENLINILFHVGPLNCPSKHNNNGVK